MNRETRKAKLHQEEMHNKQGASPSFRYADLLFFARFVRPFWKAGAAALVLNITVTGLKALLPLSSKVLIDFVIMKTGFEKMDDFLSFYGFSHLTAPLRHAAESLHLLLLGILLIAATAGAAGILQRLLMLRFQQDLTFNLQTSLFDRLLRFPLSFFRERQTGYLMARVADDVNSLQYLFSLGISDVATKVFYLVFGLSVLVMLSMKLTLIAIAVLPLYAAINYFFSGRIRDISLHEREQAAQVSRDLQEVLSGVEVVKSFTTEDREVLKVTGKMRKNLQTRTRGMVLTLLSGSSAQGIQLLSTLLIMWFGAHEIRDGAMTIGDYVAFTTYIVFLTASVNTLSMFHLTLQPVLASLSRILEIFRIAPESGEEDEAEALPAPDAIPGVIRFDHVSFSYREGIPVLRDVSFTANPGDVIALTGPSGSGKTTVVNLLLRFFPPDSGSILLDGHNLNRLPAKWLRGRIGIVSQEVFLFNDTVVNNIRYSSPGASGEEIIRAAKMANIHDEIEGLPDRYETLIGERGIRLSAGQRQRISIARAFLRNPSILILDEPTSAVDASAEKLIREAIGKLAKDRTTFIISHRHTSLDMANRVLVLDHGRLVETKSCDS
ncbi:MAG: ABC transporter ATP-binding protein [Nitrospirae bacterium]|nr:ABC transporter ATP-binding protein [Nitrospirota bacterium]